MAQNISQFHIALADSLHSRMALKFKGSAAPVAPSKRPLPCYAQRPWGALSQQDCEQHQGCWKSTLKLQRVLCHLVLPTAARQVVIKHFDDICD